MTNINTNDIIFELIRLDGILLLTSDDSKIVGKMIRREGLLEKTIESQPARMDLRLKMIEVLSSMDDSEAMAEHVDFINVNGSEADKSAVSQFQSGDFTEEVNEDFAMDFGLDDDLLRLHWLR